MRIAATLGNLREEVAQLRAEVAGNRQGIAGNRKGLVGNQQGIVGLRTGVADIAENQDQLTIELGKAADVLAQILKSLEKLSAA